MNPTEQRVNYDSERDLRVGQNLDLAAVRDRRVGRNARGHRLDCICCECFEDWRVTWKRASEAFENAMALLRGDR